MKPYLYKSPGRVNLVGEHTDYNEGFVLPAPVNRATYLAVHPNITGKYSFYAINLGKYYETSDLSKCEVHWVNYILGTII